MTDILEQLAKDTAPKNFSEFELGMVLAALTFEMNQDEDNFDPVVYDNMLEMAPEVLKYWRIKYADEIEAAGKQARKSFDRGE